MFESQVLSLLSETLNFLGFHDKKSLGFLAAPLTILSTSTVSCLPFNTGEAPGSVQSLLVASLRSFLGDLVHSPLQEGVLGYLPDDIST